MAGIICIETEWQITKKDLRRNLNTEPLMRFMGEMYDVSCIYRKVATRSELTYYLKQFQKKEYDRYNVLFFSFHGDKNCICLEGEKEELSLDTLADLGNDVFRDRYVHFSSCRTFLGADDILYAFKERTGARYISGYTKSVKTDLSAIHDISLLSNFLFSKRPSTVFKKMEKLYKGAEEELGFRYI